MRRELSIYLSPRIEEKKSSYLCLYSLVLLGGGAQGGHHGPPPVVRRVKKKVRDWLKPLYITYPNNDIYIVMCKKCHFDTWISTNLPTVGGGTSPPLPPPPLPRLVASLPYACFGLPCWKILAMPLLIQFCTLLAPGAFVEKQQERSDLHCKVHEWWLMSPL